MELTLEDILQEKARRHLIYFTRAVFPKIEFTDFHLTYYKILQLFADGKIKKLIITIPPQFGKSLGSTRLLPAFILGQNPDLSIAIASYESTFAQEFNLDIQRFMSSDEYQEIFPDTTLPNSEHSARSDVTYKQTTSHFQLPGHEGSLRAVGRNGPLTGHPVDVMIMDDLYKNAMEANSPVIRESAWQWYTKVVRTRYHNGTRELVVFTRWHEDDLIGRVGEVEKIHRIASLDQIADIPQDEWVHINFQALKESEPTEIDPREQGTSLWPSRHSIEKLAQQRLLDKHGFECMHQGNPAFREGMLYSDFGMYEVIEAGVMKKSSYTDTADTGNDYLCTVCYIVGSDDLIYVTDVVYTQEPMERTEKLLPMAFERNGTREAWIESNNGGRGFARVIEKISPGVSVKWFSQSENKEARLLTLATTVNRTIVFPIDWRQRWPVFYDHVVNFKRLIKANLYDDAPDVLTGIVERENTTGKRRGARQRF